MNARNRIEWDMTKTRERKTESDHRKFGGFSLTIESMNYLELYKAEPGTARGEVDGSQSLFPEII